jgi:glycyl-tRNA synthetase beta chain
MDYLLEIGVEELPARLAGPLVAQFRELGERMLQENRIAFEEVRVYSTPRRITLLVKGIAGVQTDLVEEVKGPPRRAAFDEAGQPTKAAHGFARGQGVAVSDLVVRATPAGEYVFARKRIQGRPTAEVLREQIPALIGGLSFPRPMRWGNLDFRFIRPIRWLVSLLGDEVVDFELSGLRPGRLTFGLRNFHPDPIELRNTEDYLERMREASIIVDQERRKEVIRKALEDEAARLGGRVVPDDDLLEEVTHLVESPLPIVGEFDPRFLRLPPEVVITPMKEHQRYFPVWDENGRLLPRFIAFANGPVDRELVRRGNEKVLRARLQDAEFFYQEDLRTPLEKKIEKLKKVVYLEGLGTVYDRVQRLVSLSRYLCGVLGLTELQREAAERAAYLSKADLVTSMVFEFPELQGIMGGYYARAGGEREEVCRAIEEHYRPRFAGDELPQTKPGAVVAIADKIDGLVGCFALGLEPSGSQDPYALRRQALGILHIALSQGFDFSLRELVARAYENYQGMELRYSLAEVEDRLEEFFRVRLRGLYLDRGYPYDLVDAALGPSSDRIQAVRGRLEALAAVRQEPEMDSLLTAYTRASRLARQGEGREVDPGLFREPEERELYDSWLRIKDDLLCLVAGGKYREALLTGARLTEHLDRFFDRVMVMVEDEALRKNRLGILKDIAATLRMLGDLDKIVRSS